LTSFFEFARTYLPTLLDGTILTLEMWVWCMLGGTILGLFLGLARVYGSRPIYAISTAYIELFRGTPMLVQILFVYFGLPEISILLTPVAAASIALGLNTAAYQAEYFRGAIQSIETGQVEAARALGMTQVQVISNVVLPQALRRVIPQWSNEPILLLKYSSIAFVIGVPELMARAQTIGYSTFRFFDAFLLAAFIYLILTSFLAECLSLVEKRVRIPAMESQG
jgi:polar amino acid transport system permease protein